MNEYKSHRRQFIVTTEPVALPGWHHVPLRGGLVLSHHPELEVDVTAAPALIHLGSRLLSGRAGRYVEIRDEDLGLTHGGLLSVYYAYAGDRPVVSSSAALTAWLTRSPRVARDVSWTSRFNWYPSPGSPFIGISRLLRDQTLHLPSLRVRHRTVAWPSCGNTYTGAVHLAQYLIDFIRALPDDRKVLALTAGMDSRLLFAAFVASGVEFETVTQDMGKRSHYDVAVASRLAGHFGVRHVVVGPGPASASAVDAWRAHTGRTVSDADDCRLVPAQQYRTLAPGDLLIRGGVFGLGRRTFIHSLGNFSFHNLTPADIAAAYQIDFDPDGVEMKTLAEWIDWRRRHELALPVDTCFHLDQRVGGWLASIEQGLDGFPFVSVNPACSDVALAALFSTEDVAARRAGRIQMLATSYLCPEALRFPINPRPLWHQPRHQLRKLKRRAKTAGRQLAASDGVHGRDGPLAWLTRAIPPLARSIVGPAPQTSAARPAAPRSNRDS